MPDGCHRVRTAGRKYCAGSVHPRESAIWANWPWAAPERAWRWRKLLELAERLPKESDSSKTPSIDEKEDCIRPSGRRQLGLIRSHCLRFVQQRAASTLLGLKRLGYNRALIRLRKETPGAHGRNPAAQHVER